MKEQKPVNPEMYGDNELLTEALIGTWLGVSRKSAHDWVNRHQMVPADVPGRSKMFRAGDVKALLLPGRQTQAA